MSWFFVGSFIGSVGVFELSYSLIRRHLFQKASSRKAALVSRQIATGDFSSPVWFSAEPRYFFGWGYFHLFIGALCLGAAFFGVK